MNANVTRVKFYAGSTTSDSDMSPPYSDCLSKLEVLESPAGRSPIPPKYCVYQLARSSRNPINKVFLGSIQLHAHYGFSTPQRTWTDFPGPQRGKPIRSLEFRSRASRFRLFVVGSAKELKAWLNPYRTAAAVRATTISATTRGQFRNVQSFFNSTTNGGHHRGRPMWFPFVNAPCRPSVDGMVRRIVREFACEASDAIVLR